MIRYRLYFALESTPLPVLGHILVFNTTPSGLMSVAESLYQVLMCHMDMIKVPFVMKTGVSATTSAGHALITEGFNNPPASSSLP